MDSSLGISMSDAVEVCRCIGGGATPTRKSMSCGSSLLRKEILTVLPRVSFY